MDEVTNVEFFFKSRQVHLSRVWLESCINWCKEENLPPNYTIKDLQFNVFEQWLLLDLRDLEVACLPPNLSNQEKFILNDNYTLQLMKIVDISKPKYWQLQRIRNGIPKNLEQEFESSKRVLQMCLTDGIQEVEATEYKPIKCLNLNLSPGIKLRLMGPIVVRRGRLMLEEKNVKVIGGEVDALLVSNAAENILASHLNQPINPTPKSIHESTLEVHKNNFNETGTSVTIPTNQTQNTQNIQRIAQVPQNQSNIQNQHSINTINHNIFNPPRNETNCTANQNNPTNPINSVSFENLDEFEEEFRIDNEIEMLMEAERDIEQSKTVNKNQNVTVRQTKIKTPDMFEDMDIDFENIDIPDTIILPNSTKQEDTANFLTKPKELKEVLKINNPSDSLELKNNVDTKIQNVSAGENITQPVIWTVDKLIKTIPNVTNGKFKIKAKFKSIIEKMSVISDEFNLVVEVGDDSGNVILRFHTDVVAVLMGLSVTAFMGFREELSNNNADAQRKALEGLKSLQSHLIALNNVLEVSVNVKEKYPIVMKIL